MVVNRGFSVFWWW